jgi:hypothetical protein
LQDTALHLVSEIINSVLLLCVAPLAVAYLINAAAAAGAAEAGPAASPDVKIYHAASAHCHPLYMAHAIGEMATFWSNNPPPIRLPFST